MQRNKGILQVIKAVTNKLNSLDDTNKFFKNQKTKTKPI